MDFEWSARHGISACSGAEVNIVGDGTFAIRVLDLSLRKNQLQVDRKKEYKLKLEQFGDLPLKGPFALTLTGKGILIKKTARLESITEQQLRQLFPGFTAEEFYVQHFPSGEQSFVAFIRKETVNPILAAFRRQGVQVLVFSLGPFAVDHVLPLLNSYGDQLVFDGHQLLFNEEQQWVDYQYTPGLGREFELKIDIEPIPQQFLLAYAAAFQLILNEKLDLISVIDQQAQQALTELLAKLKFKKNSSLALFSLFSLLLVNFLLFSHYNAANQTLASKAGQRSTQSLDRQKLAADVKEKEQQVNLLGWNHGQRYAFLLDQIGQTLPTAITLNELQINQTGSTRSTAEKEMPIATGTIKILGQSASTYAVNDWLYALKKLRWIKAVHLEKYGAGQQQEVPVFTIKLNY